MFLTAGTFFPLSTGRTTREQIELALAHAAEPGLPTDYDYSTSFFAM